MIPVFLRPHTRSRLRDTRSRLSLSQAGMAQYLGVPLPTYTKWEQGTRVPAHALTRLLDVLEIVEAHAPEIHKQLIGVTP